MNPACIAAVNKAAGRKLTDGELEGIETRMLVSMQTLARKDPIAWRGMSREERYNQAAQLARSRMTADMTRAHAQQIRDWSTKVREQQKVSAYRPGVVGQLAALRQRTIFDARGKGGDVSLEMRIKAVLNDFMRQIDDVGGSGKFMGLVQDPARQQDLVRAIFGQTVANPEIMAAGKLLRDVLEQGRQRAENAGVHINRLENWNLPQPWDWARIGDRAQFVKDVMAEIDPAGYVKPDGTPMSRADIEKLVRASAETLATDGANKRAVKAGGGFGGSVGASRNAPRQLHFRNADGYLRLMEKYGRTSDVYSTVVQHFNGLSRDIAVAEHFGRDADAFFRQLVDKAFAADRAAITTEQDAKRLHKLRLQTEKEWRVLRNPSAPGDMPLWAQVSQAIRGVAGATLLGSSTLSAIPDLQMATGYGKLIGLSRRKVLGNVLEGAKPTAENIKRIARLGIVVKGLQNAAHRFGTEELGNAGVRFLNHGVHVASGLRMWDRGMTHGVSAALMDHFGEHVSAKAWADLAPIDRQYFDSRGITEDHYNTWRLAELDKGPDANHTMLTPDSIYAIPDAKLQPLAEQRVSHISAKFAQDKAQRAVRGAEEASWVAKRVDKLTALRARVEAALTKLADKHAGREEHAQARADARAEALRAGVDRAGVETDIAGYLKTEGTQSQARAFLEAVEEGAAVERQTHIERTHPDNRTDALIETPNKAPAIGEKMNALVQRYGTAVGRKAEAFGRRQGKAEARIAEAEHNITRMEKDHKAKFDAKSNELDRRVAEHQQELTKFASRMRERAMKRAEMDDAFGQRYDAELQRETQNLRSGAVEQLLGTVLHEVQVGARGGSGNSVADMVRLGITPDARGTLRGEMMAWLLFLKQTPLGIFRTHMIDVPGGMNDWQSAWAYRAKFMAGSASLGALALTIKNIVNGNDPEDLLTAKGVGKVLIASGGLGMYGDFLLGDKGDHQNGTLTKLLGPGATEIEDLLTVLFETQDQATGESTLSGDQYSAKWLRLARNYAAPFTRVWYAKAAFNHLIYQNMMENLAPGYNDRVRQRMAKRNQSSWWPSGETLPERAPDLSKVYGGEQ